MLHSGGMTPIEIVKSTWYQLIHASGLLRSMPTFGCGLPPEENAPEIRP